MDNIMRFVKQRCIGHQRGHGGLNAIIENYVQYTDLSYGIIYSVHYADGTTELYGKHRPRIDIEVKNNDPTTNS